MKRSWSDTDPSDSSLSPSPSRGNGTSGYVQVLVGFHAILS